MRTSTYEIILPLIGRDDKEIEGKTLLINGLYGAIDVVDTEIAAKIREEDFAAIPFVMRERLAQRAPHRRPYGERPLVASPGKMRRGNWPTHGCSVAFGTN